jgi:hypothetical protein
VVSEPFAFECEFVAVTYFGLLLEEPLGLPVPELVEPASGLLLLEPGEPGNPSLDALEPPPEALLLLCFLWCFLPLVPVVPVELWLDCPLLPVELDIPEVPASCPLDVEPCMLPLLEAPEPWLLLPVCPLLAEPLVPLCPLLLWSLPVLVWAALIEAMRATANIMLITFFMR